MTDKVACFGVPSIFSFKSNVCKGCKEFKDCQTESHSALLAIKEYPIATSLLAQHIEFMRATGIAQNEPTTLQNNNDVPTRGKSKKVRYALTAEQLDRIAELPKKIGKSLEKIWVRGLDKEILAKIANGENPFSMHNARPYHIAYETLKRGRVHRSKMSSNLMDSLGWTYSSAYSQVSMIWQIFPELNIAQVDGVHMVAIFPRNETHNIENIRG